MDPKAQSTDKPDLKRPAEATPDLEPDEQDTRAVAGGKKIIK